MATARFHIDPGLMAFLPRGLRADTVRRECARAATLKNAIEALGIPHTEVARLTVGDAAATLDRIVREGDEVLVCGWHSAGLVQPAPCIHFVADAHLGALARFLRMLGFDTLHDNALSDETIRRLADAERRIVLTRDRELLKCREIATGAYVRALAPQAQLQEVAARFGLVAHARPFTLCLCCNVALARVDKAAVIDRLPHQVARSHERFLRCARCDRIYWRGSHYARMLQALQDALGVESLDG